MMNHEDIISNLEQSLKLSRGRSATFEKEIERLKFVNKQLIELFDPIDKLVRPLTKLGESVHKKAFEIIEKQITEDLKK